MIACLILLTTLTPIVSFEPGYYTLQEVASRCKTTGIDIVADKDCANDIYAVRANGLEWESFKSALARDQRVEIVQEQGQWHIRLNATTLVNETSAQKRYVSSVRSLAAKVYSRAASECRYIESATEDLKQKAIDIYNNTNDPDPYMAASNNLIRLIACAHEETFPAVGLPNDLMGRPLEVPFGKWQYSSLEQARYIVDPIGDVNRILKYLRYDVESMDDQAKANATNSVQLAGRIDLEPVSGSMSTSLLWLIPMDVNLLMGMTFDLGPSKIDFRIAYTDVLERTDSDLLAKRAGVTTTLASDQLMSQTFISKRQTLSSIALTWADKVDANVIIYVSPLSDFRMNVSKSTSLSDLVSRVNKRGFEEADGGDYLAAVLGTRMIPSRKVAWVSPATVSVSKEDNVFVVRNELRFLDSLASAGNTLNSKELRAISAGKRVVLRDCLDLFARFDPKALKSSLFATQYTYFADPLVLRPFAVALKHNEALLKRIEALQGPTTASFKLADVGEKVFQELVNEIESCSGFAMQNQAQMAHPLFIRSAIRKKQLKDLCLKASRASDTLTFTLCENEWPLWAAKVKNLQ